MATIIRLKNANFSDRGFPSIDPFVAIADAAFAYDFRNRADRLVDLAGKCTIAPWRNDIVGAGTSAAPIRVHHLDSSIIETTSDNLGVFLRLGYLKLGKARTPISIDGRTQFTVMVVGGNSGETFPADRVAIDPPDICSLLDMGTDITQQGVALEETRRGAPGAPFSAGVRIKSGEPRLEHVKNTIAQKTCLFLTYDGTTWTLSNKTLGISSSTTNAEMGIASTINPCTDWATEFTAGHYHGTSTLAAGQPMLYQLAMWERLLTDSEISDQYARSKMNFAAINI